MGLLADSDPGSRRIWLNREIRHSEITESRDVFDPATEKVITPVTDTTVAEIGAAVGIGYAAQTIGVA